MEAMTVKKVVIKKKNQKNYSWSLDLRLSYSHTQTI